MTLLFTGAFLVLASQQEILKPLVISQLNLDERVFEKLWVLAIVFSFMSQEFFQYWVKRSLYHLSIKIELELYDDLSGKFDNLGNSNLQRILASSIPLFVRAGRSILSCITPCSVCLLVLIFISTKNPYFGLLIVISVLCFIITQMFMMNNGNQKGREFDESNTERRKTLNRWLKDNHKVSIEPLSSELKTYENAFLSRMLSIETNRFISSFTVLGSILLFTFIGSYFWGELSIEKFVNNNIMLVVLTGYLITQLSSIGANLSTYFILKDHVDAVTDTYNK